MEKEQKSSGGGSTQPSTSSPSSDSKKPSPRRRNLHGSTHVYQRYTSFLRARKKPTKGTNATINWPEREDGEDEEVYTERCFKATGIRPVMTGPMRMPKPNGPCPCKAVKEDGKPKKYKKCCGRRET